MILLLGWIGSILFAFCGFPQAYRCFKQSHANGVSWMFTVMWFLGEICYVWAVWLEFGFIPWMMANYFCNIFFILVILRYMVYPKRIFRKKKQ